MALWLELACRSSPEVSRMPDPPVLLVVDDDPHGRGLVEGELRKRYGADYQVICARSGDDPLSLLARLRDDRRLVSIVMASQGMPGMTGTELLARVRDFHRAAKCLLLIDWDTDRLRSRSCRPSRLVTSMPTWPGR